MKKFILIFSVSLLLILCYTSVLMATEKTLVEEKWENYLETANLEFDTYHGKFQASGGFSYDDLFDMSYLHSIIDCQYGIYNNLEFDGYIDFGIQNTDSMVDEDNLDAFGAALKYKIYNQNGYTVTTKGYVTFKQNYQFPEDGPDYGFTLFSNVDLTEDLTLYNNAYILSHDFDFNSAALVNGFNYTIDEHSALKGYLFSNFNMASEDFTFKVSSLYKNQFSDKFTYLLEIEKTVDSTFNLITNTIENKITPSLTLTGEFSYNTSKAYYNVLLFNLHQKYGSFDLDNTYQFTLPGRSSTSKHFISSEATYNLIDNMDIIFAVNSILTNSDTWSMEFDTTLGVQYEI